MRAEAERLPGRGHRPHHRHADRPAPAGRGRGPGRLRQERGYPPSIGSAGAPRPRRRTGWPGGSASTVDPDQVAATIGSKELVAGVPQWLRLRTTRPRHRALPGDRLPDLRHGRHARSVPVGRRCRSRATGALDLAAIDRADAARALCLWSNTPGQPHRRARRPRRGGRVGPRPRRAGAERRVLRRAHLGRAGPHDPRARRRRRARRPLAVEALEPGRGARAASTPATPSWSASSPRCASTPGSWCPGPVQAAAAVALDDDAHVDEQRARYRRRLDVVVDALRACGFADRPARRCLLPVGAGARRRRCRASPAGSRTAPALLVTPGATYGPDGAGFVRLAAGAARRGHRPGGGAPRGGGRGAGMTGRGGRAPGMMGR